MLVQLQLLAFLGSWYLCGRRPLAFPGARSEKKESTSSLLLEKNITSHNIPTSGQTHGLHSQRGEMATGPAAWPERPVHPEQEIIKERWLPRPLSALQPE